MDVRRYGEESKKFLWKVGGAVVTRVVTTWAMMTEAVIGMCWGNTDSDDMCGGMSVMNRKKEIENAWLWENRIWLIKICTFVKKSTNI